MYLKQLHHPCYLVGPQHSSRGLNQKWLGGPHEGEIDTSALLSRGYPNVHGRYIKQKWLGGPHVGKIDTSPMRSRGSPTFIVGTNSKMARWPASTLIAGTTSKLARWPACGQNRYITDAVSGVPNAHCGD